MKRWGRLAVMCLLAPLLGQAQSATSNPVSTELQRSLDSYAKNLVAAAEEFPAEKYTYHPTPAEMTVGATMAHIAQVNYFSCANIGGTPAPQRAKAAETDKDKLVEELKGSMDFCRQAFSGLSDAKLGESIPGFGRRPTTRFASALEVTSDLADHYATLSVYLRLNGMLPPTAQKKQ